MTKRENPWRLCTAIFVTTVLVRRKHLVHRNHSQTQTSRDQTASTRPCLLQTVQPMQPTFSLHGINPVHAKPHGTSRNQFNIPCQQAVNTRNAVQTLHNVLTLGRAWCSLGNPLIRSGCDGFSPVPGPSGPSCTAITVGCNAM